MEPRTRRKIFTAKNFMVWFFIIIMTFSIGGYFLTTDDGSIKSIRYNDFSIYRQGNLWFTKFMGKPVPFTFVPQDVENIKVDPRAKSLILGKDTLYVTFNPNLDDLSAVDLARYEMQQDLLQIFSIYVKEGISSEHQDYDLDIITCENATAEMPVIFLHALGDNPATSPISANASSNNSTGIWLDGDCIVVQGNSKDYIRLKDRLMYHLVGVMD